MAFAGTKNYYSKTLAGSKVNAKNNSSTGGQASFSTKGLAEVDPTKTDLTAAILEQGGILVDYEGTLETVTENTAQTATTLSALFLDNNSTAVVFDIRDNTSGGTLLAGPFTVESAKGRIIIFPVPLVAATAILINNVSGTFDTVNGYLIP